MELKKRSDHPGADEVYLTVKKQFPNLSLGTVYRNLEQLAAAGLITKLEFGRGQQRFDARLLPHTHFRCLQCNRVEDVPLEIPLPDSGQNHPWFRQRKILGSRLEYFGLCPLCRPDALPAADTRVREQQ